MAPASKFQAPHTTSTGPSPASSVAIRTLSALGCELTSSTLATTTSVKPASITSMLSTSIPRFDRTSPTCTGSSPGRSMNS